MGDWSRATTAVGRYLGSELIVALDPAAGDDELVAGLHALLGAVETDMTIYFRRLATALDGVEQAPAANDATLVAPLWDAFYTPDRVSGDHVAASAAWLRRLAERLAGQGLPAAERRARLHAANPKYVLRNYLAQLAIDRAEQGDPSLVRELLGVLRRPYDEQPEHEAYFTKRPEWARERPGCSMLSCSS